MYLLIKENYKSVFEFGNAFFIPHVHLASE